MARISSAARQTVSGYLPYVSGPTGNRTRISATPGRCRPVGPSARNQVDLIGVEPITPILQGSVAPNGMQARLSEVRPGIEPGLRPYHRRVLPEHLQTKHQSDRGWNRTIDLLVVTQASSPLDHAIIYCQ